MANGSRTMDAPFTGQFVFSVDGVVHRRCPRPPTYPLQLMITVYDFPDRSTGDDGHLVPRLVVDRVAGDRQPSPGV